MRYFWTRRKIVLVVVILAALLRLWAAWQLPLDADEPTYLQAGFDYARLLRSGDFNEVIDYSANTEHPPLVKLLYGVGVLALGKDASPANVLFTARAISAVFGVLAVWVVALVSPLAGFLLAIQTLVVKYTSQAYLEALPLFAASAAVLSLLRSRGKQDAWFWISALALGLTAAGKYTYFPVLVVILYLLIWDQKTPWPAVLAYLVAAGLAFWALDPALWHDPANRLLNSIFFHLNYSQSAHVQLSGYPWYQPFIWVSRSMPYIWHPSVFFYLGFDGLIATLAVVGVWWEWRLRRWVVVWMVAGMIFLLLWPTKWPQYALVVLPAFCLAAATSIQHLYAWAREEEMYWSWLREVLPRPSRLWVFVASGLLLAVTVGQIIVPINQALLKRGWWQLNSTNTLLPGNTVYTIQVGSDGRMILGCAGGAVLFTLSNDTHLPQNSLVFTAQNSGLPGDEVFAIGQDNSAGLWFGTQAGLGYYSGGNWRKFQGQDFGLGSDQVNALHIGKDQKVWVGTPAGLAVLDGQIWRAFTAANSGLLDNDVIALALATKPAGDMVWAATQKGVSRLDSATGQWTQFPLGNAGLSGAGISDLLVDTQGRLWMATLGDGLARWDGQTWAHFRVSNSGIPSNTVQRIVEARPGVYWISIANPTEVGGILVRFDEQHWESLTPHNSGFSGAEPLAFALDAEKRLWIGTRTEGVEIYQAK